MKIIQFMGMDWYVRQDGVGDPGNNNWKEDNAFVDENGYLHLKLTFDDGKWYAAEVFTKERFDFGTFQFKIDAPLGSLDKNVVIGLFQYPTPDVGANGTNEIDIEIAQWGNAAADRLYYTIWPIDATLGQSGEAYPLDLTGTWTTHRYKWSSTQIHFQSTHGHFDDNRYPIADYVFAPSNPLQRIAQHAMPVHMNIWAFGPPSTTDTVEVVVMGANYFPPEA
ncbi:glycoside hydrolase family 16 protein [Brevundimonas diminuta]|uniref:glycoside hydrolase family 16 protein n=1 Tax=Brevundimonas diminuta TaxID=293 RepID=UPI0022AEAF4C|nr:glycoside hydrolase family 16 protein [Brevundimonas diminuta]MCZ4108968.1 glycoside hydrolase family 16 protein [Brevundimonas diminuta]